MVRLPKVSRLAVVAVLAVAAVGFTTGVGSAQEPTPTGSLTDNGNGTVTMVFDDDGGGATYFLALLPVGTKCPNGDITSPTPVSEVVGLSEYFAATPTLGPATPTVEPGLEVFAPPSDPAILPAGDYQLCLYWSTTSVPVVIFLDELEAEISDGPEPTTTVAPTTTTVPDATPVTPRYTG